MKIKLLFVLIFSTFILTAQSNKELADKYLSERGELVFTFTANTIDEVRQLSRILSFDHGQDRNNPLTIKAIANRKNFNKFLGFNLPFTVDIKVNEPKEVVMFDPKIHKKGVSGKNAAYTLAFPLSTYPTYVDYAQQMADFAADHPLIAELVDIGGTDGTSVVNPRLLFIKLSDNVGTREQEPRVMYTSSMHGDEIAGYPSMLNLIDYFITAYEDTGHVDHARVKNLLDNSEVWINPMANPDGTFYGSSTYTSVSGSRRYNDNGVDLNRNYPAPGQTVPVQGGVFQVETQNFMALAASTHFVLSANFHGGEEVVNYPWDFTYDRHADDVWWQLVSTEYAANAQNDSPVNYEDTYNNNRGFTNFGYMDFDNGLNSFPGISHGADWYLIAGGRQDYMNYDMQCREVTFEISSTKTPPTSVTSRTDEIIDFWNYNQEAYIEYLIQGTYGFQGVVKDAISGDPIKAKITLIENSVVHDALGSWVETELPLGDFYRPINAGTYDILIEADCYTPVTLSNQIIGNYQTKVLADVLMIKTIDIIPSNLTVSTITNTSATVEWGSTGGSSYDIQYRIDGTSDTWISVNSNSLSLNLINLTANTTYEFQVSGVCSAANSAYSNSATFTTALSYCTSSGTTGSKGITNVTFNTINNPDTDNTNTGYEDFTLISTDVYLGNSYNLTVNVNTGAGNNTVFAIASIDFNRDGDFDDIGETFNLGSASKNSNGATSVTPSIQIPLTASTGNVRLRISSKLDGYPTSCETGFDGEVEDYTLNIIDATLGIQDEILNTFNLYPNPVKNGELKLQMPKEITDYSIRISNVLGQKVYENKINSNYSNIHTVNTSSIKPGLYFVTVSTNLGKATKKMIIE